MLRIGLTGGIGSGKSTVADLFYKLGAPVIDADIIAHQLVEPDQPALAQVASQFGVGVINADGSLNRTALREMVFSDAEKKRRLEALLHPLIHEQIEIETRQANGPYCIICIPLLLETGMTDLVDRILVIDCPVEMQIERVKKRSALSTSLIADIIATQVSRETRLSKADYIIDNSKSANLLAEQVKNLHNLYIGQR